MVSLPKHSFGCKSWATRLFVQQTFPVNNTEDGIFHHSHRVIACYPSITVSNDDHCANVDHVVWLIPAHVVQWNVWSVIDGMGMQPLEREIRWWGSTDTPFGMSGMARAWPFLNKSTISCHKMSSSSLILNVTVRTPTHFRYKSEISYIFWIILAVCSTGFQVNNKGKLNPDFASLLVVRRIDLIPLTLNIKFHWLKLNCLFKSLCMWTKKTSTIHIVHWLFFYVPFITQLSL